MGVGISYRDLALAQLSGEWLHTPPQGPHGYPLGWFYIQHDMRRRSMQLDEPICVCLASLTVDPEKR
jgi:hypothetical protein